MRLILLYFAVILVISCQPQEKTDLPFHVWEMKDGIAVIEVESVKHGGPQVGFWEPVSDSIQEFSGKTAFIWQGKGNPYRDPLVIDAPFTDVPNKLTYEIWVDEPGEYEIKIRNYHTRPDGDNDAWISINKKMYQKIWDHDSLAFTWSEAISNIINYQPFELKKGINTFDIVGRSKGWIIDRIVIFKKDTPESVWGNLELPQSNFIAPEKSDQNAPEVPNNLKVEYTGISNVKLSWQASTDDHRIYGYEIYNDGEMIGFANEPIGFVNQLEPGKEYNFSVKAVDFSGNKSDFSSPIAVNSRNFDDAADIVMTKTSKAILIDGKQDDVWNNAKVYPLAIASGKIDNETDLSANIQFMWNDEHLFVYLQVNDDLINTEGRKYDGFSLYLDMDHNKTTHFSINDRIYNFSLPSGNIREVISRDDYVKGIQQSLAVNSNSYVVEFAIPWSTLGKSSVENMLIGLDVVVKDYDQEEQMEGSISLKESGEWAGSSPFFLGSAKLISTQNL